MAGKTKAKTGVKTTKTEPVKSQAMTKMTTVSFRTKVLLKKKAESVFDDMGITTSAAINMFLAQVVRDKGLPFTPNTQRKTEPSAQPKSEQMDGTDYIALEELWDEL